MDISFGDWYRQAQLVPEDGLLKRRQRGIEDFVNAHCSAAVIADLARLFHARAPKEPSFVDQFRRAFHTVDAAFAMEDNDNELSVLAGASLAYLIDHSKDPTPTVAALAILCPMLKGVCGDPVVPAIAARAKQRLQTARATVRKGSSPTQEAPALGFTDETLKPLTDACASNQLPEVGKQVCAVVQSICQDIQRQWQVIVALQRDQALRAEESDILWWLTGQTSRDLGQRFSNIPKSVVPILAAKELADLVRILPGPIAACAVLDVIIGDDRNAEVQVAQAIKDCDATWRKTWMLSLGQPSSIDLCPVLFAIRESASSDESTAWHATFKSAIGASAKSKLKALDLAAQVYDECLLLRACSNA